MLFKGLVAISLSVAFATPAFATPAFAEACADADYLRKSLNEAIASNGPDRAGNIKYYETLLNEKQRECDLKLTPEEQETQRKEAQRTTEEQEAQRKAKADEQEAQRKAKAEEQEAQRKAKAEMALQITRDLMEAKANARYRCKNRLECEKVFSLTQIFIVQHSDMKIQVANDSVIETFNPSEELKLALKAIKMPRAGTSADVFLIVNCRDDNKKSFIEFCESKSLSVYKSFPNFIRNNLIE